MRGTLEETKRAFIASQFPRLIIRDVITTRDLIQSAPAQIDGTLEIFNSGQSTAHLMEMICIVWLGERLPMGIPYAKRGGDKRDKPMCSLPPGQFTTQPFYEQVAFDEQSRVSRGMVTQNGTRNIYAMGQVIYHDDIRTQRTSRFCRVYDRSIQRFVSVNDPDYQD